MDLDDVLTLDADLSLTDALAAVGDAADDLVVVVVDRSVTPAAYHGVPAYLVREAAAIGDPSTIRLREVFVDGARWSAIGTTAEAAVTSATPAGTLVLRGSQVVGMLSALGGDRSAGAAPQLDLIVPSAAAPPPPLPAFPPSATPPPPSPAHSAPPPVPHHPRPHPHPWPAASGATPRWRGRRRCSSGRRSR